MLVLLGCTRLCSSCFREHPLVEVAVGHLPRQSAGDVGGGLVEMHTTWDPLVLVLEIAGPQLAQEEGAAAADAFVGASRLSNLT